MLMQATNPIALGTGEIVSFKGKYAVIANPTGESADVEILRSELTRMLTANHELAHTLAAVASGVEVKEFRITPMSGRLLDDGLLGYVDFTSGSILKTIFILLVGWAWEQRYGIPCRGNSDYAYPEKVMKRRPGKEPIGCLEDLSQAAIEFVETHRVFIMDLATDVSVDMANKQGRVSKNTLRSLCGRLADYLKTRS